MAEVRKANYICRELKTARSYDASTAAFVWHPL